MQTTINKKVNLNLIGLDSNAFSIMGAFSKQARKEGWTPDEIKEVTDEATNGDYNHLLATFSKHCESAEQDEDNDLGWDFSDEEDEDDDY